MTMAEADNILGMAPDRLHEFMAECRANKTLSTIIKRANAAILGDDLAARDRARRVLQRMGLWDAS